MIQGIDIKELKKVKRETFTDCDTYEQIWQVCKIYFGGSATAYPRKSKIVIKDRINLVISLSGNECKAYFYTYICEDKERQLDFFNEKNYTFRLFSIDEIAGYLQIKAIENEFIINNEG